MNMVRALPLTPRANPPSRPVGFQIVPAMRARYGPHHEPLKLSPVSSVVNINELLVGELAAVHTDHLFFKVRFALTPTLPREFGDGILVAHRAAGLAGLQVARQRIAEFTFESTALHHG